MISLEQDLQTSKVSLSDFETITLRILNYLPNVLSEVKEKQDYLIYSSKIAGTTKYIRPINSKLFLNNPSDFSSQFKELQIVLEKIKYKESISESEMRFFLLAARLFC